MKAIFLLFLLLVFSPVMAMDCLDCWDASYGSPFLPTLHRGQNSQQDSFVFVRISGGKKLRFRKMSADERLENQDFFKQLVRTCLDSLKEKNPEKCQQAVEAILNWKEGDES